MKKEKITLDGIKVPHFRYILAVALIIFLSTGILFYLQHAITLESLIIWVLESVVIGLLFIFGIRVSQRDGFVDGFKNGRDGVQPH